MTRSADNAVGMMDSAYFVSRTELLSFFNELLDLNIKKIEETASGAIACQLTEYIFRGSIPLTRINWEAKSDYEFVSNYKLLQAAFTRHSVKRYVDVDKLIRAKYQDNLEFCQWLKAFFEQSGAHRKEYDGRAVRAKGKGGKKFNDSMDKATSNGKVKSYRQETKRSSTTFPATNSRVANRSQRPVPINSLENKDLPVKNSNRSTTKNQSLTVPANIANENEKIKKINSELQSRVAELEGAVGDIEKERDFYFGKLRSIELFLQIKQDKNFEGCVREDVVSNIFKVLYATVDDDVIVSEGGEVVAVSQKTSSPLDDISADLNEVLDSNENSDEQ